MTEDFYFYKQLSWTELQNNLQQSAFPDLFGDDTVCLTIHLELGKYIYTVCRNRNNYEPEDELPSGNKEDEKPEDKENPPDNLYMLYGI